MEFFSCGSDGSDGQSVERVDSQGVAAIGEDCYASGTINDPHPYVAGSRYYRMPPQGIL